jgi:hypothetical protein
MKKFKLRPELNDVLYWVHLPIILGVIWLAMVIIKPETTLGYIGSSTIGLVAGDIFAHSLLKLD